MIIFLYLNARFSDEASFVSSQGMNGVNLRELLLWVKIIPKYCLYCVSLEIVIIVLAFDNCYPFDSYLRTLTCEDT